MGVNVSYDGTNYTVPATSETGWGGQMTNFLVDVANSAVDKNTSQTITGQKTFSAPILNNPVFGGALTIPVGTAGAPSISFNLNASTGIYQASTNQLNISTGGTLAATFDGSQKLTLAGALQVAGATTLQSTVTMSPANQTVTISPTGTGSFVVNPATAGTIDNVAIGNTTAAAGHFTTLNSSSTTTVGNGLTVSAGGANITGTVTLGTPLGTPYGGTGLATTLAASNAGQSLVVNQAGSAYALAGPDIPGSKNVIIGGDFSINPWQRNTSFASLNAAANGTYTADRFEWIAATGGGVVTISRQSGGPDNFSTKFLQAAVTTADASPAAGTVYGIMQPIEGQNLLRFALGTASAAQMTLSFWVSSPVTGTHCVAFRNGATNRSYVATYSVAVANTWQFTTITLTGDTTGTWASDNTTGLTVAFMLAVGSTFQTAANTWTAGNFVGVSGMANVMATNANNFKLDRIQLELGPVATQFERLSVQQTLAACQRYYEKSFDQGVNPGTVTQTGMSQMIFNINASGGLTSVLQWVYQASKRTNPTLTYYSPATGSAGNARDFQAGADVAVAGLPSNGVHGACINVNSSGSSFATYNCGVNWTASAEL